MGYGRMTEAHTFLFQDTLKQRILVSQHQTLICSISVALLQRLKRVLVVLDSLLQLFDVLCSSFAESCLSLSVALLPFL